MNKPHMRRNRFGVWLCFYCLPDGTMINWWSSDGEQALNAVATEAWQHFSRNHLRLPYWLLIWRKQS